MNSACEAAFARTSAPRSPVLRPGCHRHYPHRALKSQRLIAQTSRQLLGDAPR